MSQQVKDGIKSQVASLLSVLEFTPDRTESDKHSAAIAELKYLPEATAKALEKSLNELKAKEEKDVDATRTAFLKELYAELEQVFEGAGMKVIRRKRKATEEVAATAEPTVESPAVFEEAA